MYVLSDESVSQIITVYREATAVAIDHAPHQCPRGIAALSRAATLAAVLSVAGVSEAEANGPALGARLADGEAVAPVAVTVLPVLPDGDQPPAPDAPPLDADDVDTFDVDAWLDTVVGPLGGTDGGQR